VILNDILDMSQLESGRLTLNPAALDLRALLREVEALMRPQAMAKRWRCTSTPCPAVPERCVADPTRLKQILFNLLANAIKFSERGEVLLDVRLREPDGRPRRAGVHRRRHRHRHRRGDAGALFNRFAQGDHSPRGATAAPGWAWRSRATWRG
jgi:two-component system, sensor histidine kinase